VAAAFVRSTGKVIVDGAAGTSSNCSFPTTQPAPGNAVFAATSIYHNNDPTPPAWSVAITDNQGNSYSTTQAKGDSVVPTAFPNRRVRPAIGVATSVASSGTFTATFTPGVTGGYYAMACAEFSGIGPSPTDTATTTVDDDDGTTTPSAIGPTAVPGYDDLVVFTGIALNIGSISLPMPAGYTTLFSETDGSLHVVGAFGYKIVTAAAAETASWAHTAASTGNNIGMVLAVYRGDPVNATSLKTLGPGTYQRPMTGLF
jgi:hypothetical protein